MKFIKALFVSHERIFLKISWVWHYSTKSGLLAWGFFILVFLFLCFGGLAVGPGMKVVFRYFGPGGLEGVPGGLEGVPGGLKGGLGELDIRGREGVLSGYDDVISGLDGSGGGFDKFINNALGELDIGGLEGGQGQGLAGPCHGLGGRGHGLAGRGHSLGGFF